LLHAELWLRALLAAARGRSAGAGWERQGAAAASSAVAAAAAARKREA